jgi:hypothetical protein
MDSFTEKVAIGITNVGESTRKGVENVADYIRNEFKSDKQTSNNKSNNNSTTNTTPTNTTVKTEITHIFKVSDASLDSIKRSFFNEVQKEGSYIQ